MSTNSKVVPKRQGQRMPRLDSFKNPQPRPPPQSKSAQRKNVPITCTNSQCTNPNVIEEDSALVCVSCGNVVQESCIVAEVTFGENPVGGATLQGSHVAADQSYARAPPGQRLKMSGGMDSREITEANGRRYISQLCAALNIPAVQDRGVGLFKLAAGINFIQGRRTKAVAAVCLYIACRLQPGGTKHMLIDFSDVLTLNVFKLGQTYTALLKALEFYEHAQHVQLINPEELIERFSRELEFGDSQMRVQTEAVRIVQRMNRDWMTTGRRPAGICGGALILAARMNNFRRTAREMSYVVKVAEATILKRLDEFKVTESSGLTVEEFRTIDLEHACDPPAFYEQKKGKKGRSRKRKVTELNDEEPSDHDSERAASAVPTNVSGQLVTPANTQSQAQNDAQSMPPPPVPIDPALLDKSAQRLPGLQPSFNRASTSPSPSPSTTTDNPEPKRKRGRPSGKTAKPAPPSCSELEHEAAIESEITRFVDDPSNIACASALHTALDSAAPPPSPPATQQSSNPKEKTPFPQEPTLLEPPPREPSSTKPTQTTPTLAATQSSTTTTESVLGTIPDSEIIPDEEFASDPEVTNCLLSPAEIAIKERIWVHENRDYLRAQSAKLLKQQLAEQNGTARQIVRRKRRRGRMGDMRNYGIDSEGGQGEGEGSAGPRTPAEATSMMMKRRGYSKKINYKVIEDLYVPSRSGSTSLAGTPGSAGKTAPSSPGAESAVTIAEGDAAEAEGEGEGAAAAVEDSVADEAENPDDYYEDETDEETLEDIVQQVREEEEELEDEYEGEEYE